MFYFEKQPNEIINGVGIDFTNWLEEGETINTYTVTADKSGIVSSVVKNGNRVLCTVSNGEDGEKIKLTYTIETSNNNKYETEIILNIKEL